MSDLNFDSIKHLNPYNVEYWQARELMPLLGYATRWQNFESVIKKAMISCEQTGNIITDHFTDASKMIETGKGAHRQVKDYYLSRLACYLIAMNGDPRKEEIATAQNYFAVSTRSHEIHQLYQEQQARIEIRMQVTEGSEILDHMGSEELAANLFRITQTDGKLRRERIVGEDRAIETHFGVGRAIRNTLRELHAPLPEDLPSAPSIRKQLEDRRRARNKQLRGKKQQKIQDTLL
jgi:DNA-damage-inducible protein D